MRRLHVKFVFCSVPERGIVLFRLGDRKLKMSFEHNYLNEFAIPVRNNRIPVIGR